MRNAGAAARGVGVLAAAALVGPPLWAHGEQLVSLFVSVLVLFPAALLLFIPWHRWPARIAAVGVLILATLLLWVEVLPRVEVRAMSSAEEWLFLLSPSICAAIFAAVLHRISRKRAA